MPGKQVIYMSKSECNTNKKTTIGGQALIEGIVMRGPDKTATAVRKSEQLGCCQRGEACSAYQEMLYLRIAVHQGNICVRKLNFQMGFANNVFSNEAGDEEENPSKFDNWVEENRHQKPKK